MRATKKNVVMGAGGGAVIIIHDLTLKITDPRILTKPGRSTSGFKVGGGK